VPCGWEGKRRSGVALARRRRLKWFIHLRAHGLDTEMSIPRTLSCGVWPIYLPDVVRSDIRLALTAPATRIAATPPAAARVRIVTLTDQGGMRMVRAPSFDFGEHKPSNSSPRRVRGRDECIAYAEFNWSLSSKSYCC